MISASVSCTLLMSWLFFRWFYYVCVATHPHAMPPTRGKPEAHMTRQELMPLRFWVQFWVQSHPNLRNEEKMLRYYRGERDVSQLF